jgi:hypothetical protein
MRLLILISHVLLLSACSSIVYQEPTSGPRARVRFVTDFTGVALLRAYDDANCSSNETEWMRLRNGKLFNSTPKRLGMPLWKYNENAAKEVYVDSTRQFNGLMQGNERGGAGIYSCGVPFFFSFLENTDYEVFFHWSPMSCRITISQLIDGTKGVEERELKVFANQITEINEGCMKAFKK